MKPLSILAKVLRAIARPVLPMALLTTSLMAGAAVPASAAANNGTGTMTTTTTSVTFGSTGHVIAFTYTAALGGVANGGVHLTVPNGWSAPSTTGGAAGYATASAGTVSIYGQTIVVLGVTLASGGTLTLTYGSRKAGGPGATAPLSAGAATWTATEKSTSGGTETVLEIGRASCRERVCVPV